VYRHISRQSNANSKIPLNYTDNLSQSDKSNLFQPTSNLKDTNSELRINETYLAPGLEESKSVHDIKVDSRIAPEKLLTEP